MRSVWASKMTNICGVGHEKTMSRWRKAVEDHSQSIPISLVHSWTHHLCLHELDDGAEACIRA